MGLRPQSPTVVPTCQYRAVILVLEGDGKARGLAYGEAARDLVAEAADGWRADAGTAHDALLATLAETSGFIATSERLVPDLADEIEAIAVASGVDRRTVWALNLMDEDWWTRGLLAGESACSGFGVLPAPGQHALVAQNMDLPRWLDGLQVLLDVRPSDGPRVLAPSSAGMVATNVLNEHGIGVCVNTLGQLPTSTAGLPVALMIRHLAAQRTHADALDVLRTTPHASGQNYIVGSPDTVVDLECGAGIATECRPMGGRIAHTNHPITEAEDADGQGGFLANSPLRLDALRRRLAEHERIGPDQAAAVLRDPPLCRGTDGDTGFTFYSVVMELTDAPVLHLTDGPPSDHAFATYRFST